MTPRILPESAVLAPRDPSITNTDDWSIFELSDVTVVDPNALNLEESLLRATEHHPLTVRGRLKRLDNDLAHTSLLPRVEPSLVIEITDVYSYSYAQFGNGSIGLWAAGKAGWFQINPSRAYRKIYEEMVEAVNALYFVADFFANRRKGARAKYTPVTITQALFEKYAAEKMRKGSTSVDAAEKILYEHREFLLTSMMSGKENIAWNHNPLYKHLQSEFPGAWERVRQRLHGMEQKPQRSTTQARSRGASIDSVSTSSSLKRKRGRPPNNSGVDVISIGSSSGASSTAKAGASKENPEKDSKPTQSRTKLVASQTRSTRSQPLTAPDPPPETPELPKRQRTGESDSDSTPPPRKGKSALRLKPNKPSKGPKRSVKPPSPDAEEIDETQDSLLPPPTTHPPSDLDEGISMPTSPSASPGASDFAHIPDPLAEDTWRCALVGCTHRVYAASRPESQTLIKKHYALHASDDDERVRLVQALAAPSLPAGRLIERVRMQARVELGGVEGSVVGGSRFPRMVERRL